MNIYQSKHQENYLGLQQLRYADGLRKIRYVSLKLQPEESYIINKTFIIFLVFLKQLQLRKKLLTAGSQVLNKKMTLKDKKSFSDVITLSTLWLKILVQESIGTEKDFKPFWNKLCLEKSQKLWLPTEIDYVDSLSNSLSLSSEKMMSNSLFSIQTLKNQESIMNFQKTSCQSSMSIAVEKWENEDTQEKQKLMKSKKLRIYPNKLQRLEFKKWMDTTRYVYNKGVKEVLDTGNYNFQTLRNKFVTSKDNPEVKEWELETPKDIRAGALRDLVKASKTAFTNLNRNNISHFKMGYRLKNKSFSLEIPKTSIKIHGRELNIYKTYGLGNIKICKRDSIPEIKFDCRLSIDNSNRYYLIIPFECSIKGKLNDEKCSLDPGIRKFQTLYSKTEVKKITTNYELLRKLKNKISLLSKLRTTKKIRNNTYKKHSRKMWRDHKDLIDDLQHKLCNYLSNNYNIVYLPKFESQKLTKKMNKTCNFNILNLQHYLFKERLRFKLSEYSGTLIDCTEEFTSKTCTQCGVLNDVGSSEVFNCSKCKLCIDRDINGARNIYLKCIVS